MRLTTISYNSIFTISEPISTFFIMQVDRKEEKMRYTLKMFFNALFANHQGAHIDITDNLDTFEKRFEKIITANRKKDKELKIGEEWDKLSVCKEDAIAFAHRYINEEPERYIDERKMKYSYAYVLAHCGETINERFRGNRADKDDIACATLVGKHTNDVPLVLYRGVSERVFQIMYKNAAGIDEADLYEKGFLYCSLIKGNEIPSRYHLRIFVPEGNQVFYTGNVNDEQHYYEVDIQIGGKLKIISADDKYINCLLLGTSNEFSPVQ